MNTPAYVEAHRKVHHNECEWLIQRKIEIEEMSEDRKPLWPQPVPVLGLTGKVFSGKSLFGVTICPGPGTRVYDNEQSTKNYESLGFDRIDISREMLKKFPHGHSAKDTFLWWRDHIRQIPAGKFRVIGLDTVSEIEDGLIDYVQANPAEFGKTAAQYAKAKGLMWGDVKRLWKSTLDDLASRCETFYFTAHLKSEWVGGAPTGKQIPKGQATLDELASLYLWLERGLDESGKPRREPVAEVRKSRLASFRFDPATGETTVVPSLPSRIPIATPAAIRRYMIAPPDPSNLRPEECAKPDILSEDERLAMRARIAADELEAQRLRVAGPEVVPAASPVTPAPAPAHAHPFAELLGKLQTARGELFALRPASDNKAIWTEVLRKRNVTTAKDLSEPALKELLQTVFDQIEYAKLELINSGKTGELTPF